MIRRETPNPHYLFLDTNILRAKADEELVSTMLSSFLDTYGSEFQISLLIPDVVRDEILFQKSKLAIAQLNTASSSFSQINAITKRKYGYRLTEAKIKLCLAADFKKWVDVHNGLVLPTPTQNIDFKDVIKRSVWRLPPFDKDPTKGEKGFRDAMILETLRHHLTGCSHTNPIAFICRDNLLRETAKKELSSFSFLTIYESLEELESYLKLTKQHLEEKFIREIVKKAAQKFFAKEDETSFYYTEKIRDKISDQYKTLFENPLLSDENATALSTLYNSSERQWEQRNGGIFWIYPPQFLTSSSSEKEYTWLTRIDFIRQYARQPSLMVAIPYPEERLLKLLFEVRWKAKITDAARFMKIDLVDIKLSKQSFKTATAEDKNQYSLSET